MDGQMAKLTYTMRVMNVGLDANMCEIRISNPTSSLDDVDRSEYDYDGYELSEHGDRAVPLDFD